MREFFDNKVISSDRSKEIYFVEENIIYFRSGLTYLLIVKIV